MEEEHKELPNFSMEMDYSTGGRNQQFTDEGVKQLNFVEKQLNQKKKTAKKTNLEVPKVSPRRAVFRETKFV